MKPEIETLLKMDNFAQLGTVTPQNTPHIDTVRVGFDGDQLVVATTLATRKAVNLKHNPAAFMVITDRLNPYEQAQLTLELDRMEDDENMHVCDKLAYEYTGKPFPQRNHTGRVALYFNILKSRYHVARV